MTAVVELNNVFLTYPIYSVRAQSLRNTIANLAVGGTVLRDGNDIVFVRALSGISFQLYSGDRLGVIGHNGAGKSTLLKVLAGVYEADSGLVEVRGKISSMIDISLGVDTELTGRENILTMGRMRGHTIRQIQAKVPEIIEFSDLGHFIDLPMKTYSAGMSTRLVFAVATSLDPDVLLMDEWIGAGDAGFFQKAVDRLNGVLERSRVIVLASHNEGLIRNLCNKLLVLNAGHQIYFGPVDEWDFANQCEVAASENQSDAAPQLSISPEQLGS
jgi:ABC-type polysaccharide/polyol phosphate transport system ATPase subunit